MLLSLYLLSILYTNTMGLIILFKCNPLIDKLIEEKGYIKKEKSDNEFFNGIIKGAVMFLIPGYFLRKALKLTNKDADIDDIISEELEHNEIIPINEEKETKVDSIFKKEDKLSLGKYIKPDKYKAISNEESMYTEDRYPNTDEVDMEFWEEEINDLNPYLEETVVNNPRMKKPIEEYLSSIPEEELLDMVDRIEKMRKLQKENLN